MADNPINVFFDLEATGLDTHVCDITQLSAVCGARVFNVYLLPRQAFTESAARVTGMAVRDGQLYLNGARVSTTPVAEALAAFIDFLRSFGRPVQLVAHNARRFDAPVIRRVLRQHSLLQEFRKVVCGFLDTLILSKRLYPDLSSYSQENLVKRFLRGNYDAHNAVEDSRMLQELYKTWNPHKRNLSACTTPV